MSMYYLMIHLYQEEFADDIIVALTEAGVDDVMVVDAVNASRRLAHHLPIFAGFRGELGKTSLMSKIFHCSVDSKDVVKRILELLNKADRDFEKKDMGKMILFPVEIPVSSKPPVVEEVVEPKVKKKRVVRIKKPTT